MINASRVHIKPLADWNLTSSGLLCYSCTAHERMGVLGRSLPLLQPIPRLPKLNALQPTMYTYLKLCQSTRPSLEERLDKKLLSSCVGDAIAITTVIAIITSIITAEWSNDY